MSKRMISRREMLKLMAAAAAGAALASCNVGGTPETEPADVPAGEDLEGFSSAMPPPAENIRLTYWWGNNWEPALEFTHEIIDRFSIVYPAVTIESVAGQDCDAFITSAAAGTPPDLFHTWDCVERMGAWAHRGMILPIDNYLETSDFDMDRYFPGIMDTCRMDGQTWGMVDGAGLFLLWTRPQQFSEIGQSPQSLPATTDELWEWSRELTTRDSAGNIERLGMIMPGWLWEHLTWIVNFGGVLWDTVAGEPTPEHPGVLEALNDLKAQVEFYGVDTLDRWSASIGSQGGAESPWMAGSATMQISGDWTGQSIFDFFPDWEVDNDYGVTAPPPPPAAKIHGQSAVAWWSWPWVIPSGIDHPDWSWELLRYMLSPEYQIPVRSEFKEIPVQVDMVQHERIWWPAAEVASDLLGGGRALTTVMPMNRVAAQYLNAIGEAVENVLHLSETPEQAMARVRSEIMTVMAEE
jgi:multiple sugar transport system substrate-binding protein